MLNIEIEHDSLGHCRVFNGKSKLPPPKAMRQDIAKVQQLQSEIFKGETRNHATLPWLNSCDEIADLIGCKPPLSKYSTSNASWWVLDILYVYTEHSITFMYWNIQGVKYKTMSICYSYSIGSMN